MTQHTTGGCETQAWVSYRLIQKSYSRLFSGGCAPGFVGSVTAAPYFFTSLTCISKNSDNFTAIYSIFFIKSMQDLHRFFANLFVKRERFERRTLEKLLMSRGTHIYVNCGAYTHHGIDCGDGTVIHCIKSRATICRSSWADFASGKEVFVREYGKCDPSELVVERAESRLGKNAYDLFHNNCEHFATWCKTGIHRSEQVERAAAYAGGTAGSAGTATAIAAAGAAAVPAGVAALSGAGIMSGLATVGGVVGGGALAGIGVIGAAPAVAAKLAMDQVFSDDVHLTINERQARELGRNATTVGAIAGTAGAVGAVAAAGSVAGVSAAGITSGLAAIGGVVGGGMAAGVVITAAAPVAAAAAVGLGAYHLWKWVSE